MLDYRSVIPEGSPLTVREAITVHVMEMMKNLKMEVTGQEDQPLFKNVYRGDPDDNDDWGSNNAPFVAVEDAEETMKNEWIRAHVEKDMVMFLHIRFEKGQRGVEPYTVFNYYLARLQAAIFADHRLGGTCKDVNEVQSAPQVFRQDALQGGFLQLRISYRHPRDNPYKLQ